MLCSRKEPWVRIPDSPPHYDSTIDTKVLTVLSIYYAVFSFMSIDFFNEAGASSFPTCQMQSFRIAVFCLLSHHPQSRAVRQYFRHRLKHFLLPRKGGDQPQGARVGYGRCFADRLPLGKRRKTSGYYYLHAPCKCARRQYRNADERGSGSIEKV